MPGTARLPASRLSDEELERSLSSLASAEAEATADIVEHIAEFERRRLFAPKSFPSMFAYCTRILGYSEGAAYLRIYAGRLSTQYPEILELLRTRRVHLTAIRTVGPHLSPTNSGRLLAGTCAKTERELKFLIAEAAPKPEPREFIRRLPATVPAAAEPPAPRADSLERPDRISALRSEESPPREPPAPNGPSPEILVEETSPRESPPPEPPRAVPARPIVSRSPSKDVIEPLSLHRVRFGFTGSDELLKKVDRAKGLLRHRHPAGALEDIFEETIEAFLDARDPARKRPSARRRPSKPGARRIASWIKDVVYQRDDGRCAYRSRQGVRCEERSGLEYDHIVPWAKGGPSNEPANIRLLCRAHNAYESERVFGRRKAAVKP